MRSISRRRSLFCGGFASRSAASTGLTEMASAAARKSIFHMALASRSRGRGAVPFCNDLFLFEVPVGFLDVAAQLLALLGRHLLRSVGAALALAVDLAHVLAHA